MDKSRGMLFIALNADIAGQFEMIQHTWLNNPHFNGLYTGTDPISHFDDGGLIKISAAADEPSHQTRGTIRQSAWGCLFLLARDPGATRYRCVIAR